MTTTGDESDARDGKEPTPDEVERSEEATVLHRADDTRPLHPTVTHDPGAGTRPTTRQPRVEATAEISQPSERFTLTEVLGEGAQGEVCRAFDNRLHRDIAIKFPHRSGDDNVAGEILEEARKAARLNHPNVVTIYECGIWKGRPFIAMEFVDGASLATIIKECGRISVDRYHRYARQILKALEAAHQSGLIHRDLKPHNVLVAADGTLKLTDFGIAHVRRPDKREKTMQMVVSGTPAYMAPEQWMGKRADPRSDIYAFGCMSYKLLSGRSPFPAEGAMQHHIESPPPKLRELAPHVPAALERVLLRCIAKKPESRFQTCGDLREAIDVACRASTDEASWVSEARPGSSPARGRRLVLWLSVLAVSALLIAFFTATEAGREAWSRLGGEDRPDAPPDDTGEPPDPILDETPSPPDPAEAESEARLREGRQHLETARSARTPEERLRAAELAKELLAGSPGEFKEAARLFAEAKAEKEKVTEQMVTEEFERVLAAARSLRAEGRLDEALQQVGLAEEQVRLHDTLRTKDRLVKQAKLPVIASLARRFADEGRYADASSSYDEAANLADALRLKDDRDRNRKRAEITRTLHRCDLVLDDQPRYVVVQLARLGDGADFPSRDVLAARAQLELGFAAAARERLEHYLAGETSPGLVQEAKTLLQSLD